MSLNVLNKNFLSLLCQLGIDIDIFRDKTFDGLFERRQNDLNYFLGWFVTNITPNNALTEAEIDIYQYLKACDLCVTDEELNLVLLKWNRLYEDLELIDENYIDGSLAGELEGINREYELLKSINCDLEKNYGKLKRKPNQIKEECNRTRRILEQIKDKLQVLSLNFSSVNEDVTSFKLNSCNDIVDLKKFKNCAEEEEKMVEEFTASNSQSDEIIELLNVNSDEISKLKIDLKMSKYCSLVSKSVLEEARYQTLRAEDFLNKLKNESDSHFTFEEVLSVCFDLNDPIRYNDLAEETNCLQVKDLKTNLDKECDLIWHNILSCIYYHKLCENKHKSSVYSKFLKHIKRDIVNNGLLQHIMKRSEEKEKELAESINGFYRFLEKNENYIRNGIEKIMSKDKKTQDYCRKLNEKHALLMCCKNSLAKSVENDVNCDNYYDAVEVLFDSPCFCPEEFLNGIEYSITSRISNVLCSPTNQIKMSPVEVEWEFSKCCKSLAEYSHSIQKMLTQYVNAKEAVTSSNRRQLLLWIDFLINPDVLTAGLEQLQEKSIMCASKLSDV